MSSARSPVALRYDRRGTWLPEAGLWLDAAGAEDFSFVSHAHADHVARHRGILCSPATAWLMRRRFGSTAEMLAPEYGEPVERNGHRLVLTPAGHILGSAMIHITRLADGASLLYTGDFKLRDGFTGEKAEPLPADTVIMECTFGRPHFLFPPREETARAMRAWCRNALDGGEIPVLLGYSLGKAQEIQAALGGEFPVAVHPSVAEMNAAYEDLGHTLPPWETYRGEAEGRVLVFPPSAVKSTALRKLKRAVTAMVSGWALNPGARYQYQTDEVFPLSDHADYAELLRLVELTSPRTVLTTHGWSAEFSRDLRAGGQDAWSLAGSDQLELLLGADPPEPEPVIEEVTPEDEAPPAPDSLAAFSAVCEAAAAASSRLQKTALLAEYLRSLPDPVSLADAARFIAAQPAAGREDRQAMQTGYAVIRHALLEATGCSVRRFREISRASNDAGRTAFLTMQGRTAPRDWSLAETRELFDRLRLARGPSVKSALLTEAFRQLSAADGRSVVTILTGDTRIGLKEGLLEEAIAKAFDSAPEEVREAHMLTGDPGETARLARAGELHTADMRPFQPVRVMLASPELTAADIWARLGGAGEVWLEDKFDGIRAQLHRADGRVSLYSRDLRPMDREFPDLLSAAAALPADVVLDGEIIAFAEGKQLGFSDLQKRLGRRQADLFLPGEIPLKFVAFDLLWLDGRPLLKEPLRERRRLLEGLRLPTAFSLLEVARVSSDNAVHQAFLAAKARGNEGLIAKDPESPYAAGRRGKSWLKLKISALSLDVVVTAAEQGHGKRRHVLSDYTFAVRDEKTGALLTIGKAYSGLTDAEIEELTAHFEANTLETDGRRRLVVPDIVLEIAFDSIQPSKRHESGLALRFPRIKAIRRDRTPDTIDTLSAARVLAGVGG